MSGRRTMRAVVRNAEAVGLDGRRLLSSIRYAHRFIRDLLTYGRSARNGRFPIRLTELYPVLTDYGDTAGQARGHYFHQDLWAARLIHRRRPQRHLDVGSRIDGFVAHLLTFMPVSVIDIRPLRTQVHGLEFIQADATTLEGFPDNSEDSISSLHALEHFGLGRYGDPVDPDAWRHATRALARVLHPGGRLYFSVPIGRERVQFNAHRVFAPATILEAFADLQLVSFAQVDDDGNLRSDVRPEDSAGADYACGLFEYTKRLDSPR